jgi:hypothetical protein
MSSNATSETALSSTSSILACSRGVLSFVHEMNGIIAAKRTNKMTFVFIILLIFG